MNTNMNKARLKVSALLEKYFLPLLLGAVVMNVIFNTYYRFYTKAATVGFFLFEAFLFWFFEKLKKKKILRFFVYVVLAFMMLWLSGALIGYGWSTSGVSFIDWFYVNSQEVGSVWYYNIFLFTGLGFFIISVLYYFTVYRFRIFGVMLVTMFPFVIYGKRSDNITTLNLTFMMTIFLAMMVHQRLVTDDAKRLSKLRINPSYTIALALFVSFVGALTMVLPKPDYNSALEENRGIFKYTIGANRTDYDDLNEESSPRFGADATGEILFYANSTENDEIIYIRRQSFDVFRNDRWVNDEAYFSWYDLEDDVENEVNSPLYLYSLMKRLAETGRYEDLGLTTDLFDKYGEYSINSYLNIFSSSYSPSYIPAPLMAKTDHLAYCFRAVHGEVYYNQGFGSNYGGLGVSYSYCGERFPEMMYITDLPFSWDDFKKIMLAACDNGDVTESQLNNIYRMYELYTDTEGVTEDIDKLAHEITDQYDTDYEKCEAIVDYFIKNGYIYDLDFEPDDESIDYFLFESKTGVCTSYATSMVLMARAVGIPSRYVEGFAALERDEEGSYVVRDSHAHAFVEAYIPGAGWMTFDPTVPDYKNQIRRDNNTDANVKAIGTFIDFLSRIILFLGVMFVLIFIVFIDKVIEYIFRIRMRFTRSNSLKAQLLYRRILRLLDVSSDRSVNVRGMTPREILAFATSRGAEVSRAVEIFERSAFGSYEPADVEVDAAYSCYKQSWKALAGKNRKKKKLGHAVQ